MLPLGVEGNVSSSGFLWLLYLEHFTGSLSFSSKFSPTWNLGLLLGLIKSQFSVRFLSLFWITGGPTIHRPIEGLLPPTDTKLTHIWHSVFKVAGLQVHAATQHISTTIGTDTSTGITATSITSTTITTTTSCYGYNVWCGSIPPVCYNNRAIRWKTLVPEHVIKK